MFLQIKRISVEIAIIASIALLLWLTPVDYLDPNSIQPKIAILATLLMKALQTSAGMISGHIARKMFLPYVDFRTEIDPWKKVLVIVFYILGVYGWINAG